MTQTEHPADRLERPDREPILEVDDLRTHFFTREGVVKAVDGVSFTVRPGEVLGIVGESGCGKSVTSLSIMGLVPRPGKIVTGSIRFEGQELVGLPRRQMSKIRGDQISMIFQQPQGSLNPVYRVGNQIAEVFELHRKMPEDERYAKAVDILRTVGIPDPKSRAESFPHEMSGGMAQRVMIAMALALQPDLLIADEPTTALDVTIQAQILDLMRELQRDFDTAVILITHDLGVVAEMADRVAVMYAGEIVEESDVDTIFSDPKHPYTQGLIGSIPVLGEVKDELDVIPGIVPSLMDLPPGCRFASRCTARIEYDIEIPLAKKPPLKSVGDGHRVRCWLYHDSEEDGYKAPLADNAAEGAGDG